MEPTEKHVDRLIQQRSDATGSENHFTAARGVRDSVIMLSIRKMDGNLLALPYMYLAKIEFDPSENLVLDLAGYQITICGYNLQELYRLFCDHRIRSIRAADSAMESKLEGSYTATSANSSVDGKPFVKTIEVVETQELGTG